MPKQPEIILHVGMHKTGTTFLQWNVFPYVDANFLWHIFYKSWLKNLLKPDKQVDYNLIKQKLNKLLTTDKINIISEENIYTYQFTKEDERFKILDRIKKIFPQAKIIIGTRKKEENLVSWYVEYVAVGGTLDYQGFLDNYMNLEKLNYEPYIKKLKEYYGEKNVFVYRMDELRKNQDDLVNRICKFMNIKPPTSYKKEPARVGYGVELLKISLFLNRFFKTPVNPHGWIPWWGPALPQNIIFHSFIVKHLPRTKVTMDYLKKMKINF